MDRQALLGCIACEKTYTAETARYFCDCGQLLEVRHQLDQLKKKDLLYLWSDGVHNSLPDHPPDLKSGVWKYHELLPPISGEDIVSWNEGRTRLYRFPRLETLFPFELDRIYWKHEGENPTGSFKDRGMTVGVSMAKALGVQALICASTGNTAASLASYGRRADLPVYVLISKGNTAIGKVSQSLAYGAKVLEIDGSFDRLMSIVKDLSAEKRYYVLNSINPFRLEGQKTIIFELYSQLGWTDLDMIFVPGGNLGNTAAFGKALDELHTLGLIKKIPQLIVVQAAGANPFYTSFQNGFQTFSPRDNPQTLATAIRIGNPVNYEKAKKAIQFTNGRVVSCEDEAILGAKVILDREGIGAEPASAAGYAGLLKLWTEKKLIVGGKAAIILTGHILKDSQTVMDYHAGRFDDGPYVNKIISVVAETEAVRKLIDKS